MSEAQRPTPDRQYSAPRRIASLGQGVMRCHGLLFDFVVGAWLAYSYVAFSGQEAGHVFRFAVSGGIMNATAFAVSAALWGHGASRWRMAAIAPPIALIAPGIVAVATLCRIETSPSSAIWFAVATLGLHAASRLVLRCVAEAGRPAEMFRWTVLAAASAWIIWPFHTHRTIGAGDAHWYTLMLADYAEQIRLGQFPVWVGATEYAFNGAVSPLRLAPWYQHFGALLDLLTGRSLDFVALKNLVIVVNMALISASSYVFVRSLLGTRPTLAFAVVLALVSSPGVLAPLYVGDQIMTFLALPFLPPAFYGLWRAIERNDTVSHLCLAIGVAGLWWSHPPIALWTSILASVGYAAKIALRWSRRGIVLTAHAAIAFLVFGSYPLVSALTLENVSRQPISGEYAAEQVRNAFPANFLPLSGGVDKMSDYQIGYGVLMLLVVALVSLVKQRSVTGLVFAGLTLIIAGLVLPVPWLTKAIWENTPAAVMQATNNWPMQRLFPIWGFLTAALFGAAVFRQAGSGRSRERLMFCLIAVPVAWQAVEAGRMKEKAKTTIARDTNRQFTPAKHNLLLTRYSFVSFEKSPAYFSHGYLDPILEHRLLRTDGSILAENAESAARKGVLPAPNPAGSALVASGSFRAVNDNNTTYYNLEPRLKLPSNTRLALWLDPIQRGEQGWLQIFGQDLFREYILPDSGVGAYRREPSKAFGTLPSSSRIVSLFTRNAGETAHMIVISPHREITPEFDFARFELWKFEPGQLPVEVKSWVPYRLLVNSPESGYLETPRMWLQGYRAKINGQRVKAERSPENLAMFKIPAGHSDITIKYVPSIGLELVYWMGIAAWTLLAAGGAAWLRRSSMV